MATFITPDYILNKIKQREGEDRLAYRDRLSRIMLDETEEQMIRSAANKQLWNMTSYE